MNEPLLTDSEAKRRAKLAYEIGCQETRAELSVDLRQLAQLFAAELRGLRNEMREALGKPPLPDYCDCDDQSPLQ